MRKALPREDNITDLRITIALIVQLHHGTALAAQLHSTKTQ